MIDECKIYTTKTKIYKQPITFPDSWLSIKFSDKCEVFYY